MSFGFINMVKESFFDRKAVMDAAGRARVSALSKGAAFVRKVVQNSMRRRKKSAAQGMPPSQHAGDLKRLIFFAYDPSSRSAVVGPVKFKTGEAPRLLEFGGDVTRKGKTLHYAGNAFMAPGLQKTADAGKLPAYWANSVRSN